MKVVDLRCTHGHRFEGWFGSEDELVAQLEQARVECPLCGDSAVTRMPSSPRLNLTAAPPDDGPKQSVTQSPDLQAMWLQAVRHVLEKTEDVGEGFPEEARRIHYGEAPERGIRGRASRAETDALREEGIEVMPLPLPPALKGPVQ
jgi:hypothetical protein